MSIGKQQSAGKHAHIRSLLGIEDDDLFPHGAFKEAGPEILVELRNFLHDEGVEETVIDCANLTDITRSVGN